MTWEGEAVAGGGVWGSGGASSLLVSFSSVRHQPQGQTSAGSHSSPQLRLKALLNISAPWGSLCVLVLGKVLPSRSPLAPTAKCAKWRSK